MTDSRSSSLSRSLSDRPTPSRSNSHHAQPSPKLGHAHRPSFDHLRGMPPSPRQQRHPSISHIQIQDLVNNPPTNSHADPRFVGRDWQHISISELAEDVLSADMGTPVEDATKLLTESQLPVLVREDDRAIATFDFRDLNQYLLFATGQLNPPPALRGFYQELAQRAQAGEKIPLRDVKKLGGQDFVELPGEAQLTAAVEVFGGGVHNIVTERGVLTQLRLVKFLWENSTCFPVIEEVYARELGDLGIGSQHLISINGDRPLKEALMLMNTEGVSSLAVVDHGYNVVGNISNVDVKLLTTSSSAPLLENTCLHFISVILSTRGMNDGKDSYPVYYVNPDSTLAHAVAKLVATSSHRMWVVDPGSPTVEAHAGRLIGVVSLTDILNLFAKVTGLHPQSPDARRRRGSSSSSRWLTLEVPRR